ncbi:MAG: FixH family protein [Gammaproteobacteria bacterium]|nr:FixH family protein [Gammaproteobacteria bacterium]
MRSSPESRAVRPWYRQFHVWLLIFFPALSVAGGLATVWIAVSSDDGLVVDDYYREGLKINQVLERDRAAAAHALSAEVRILEKTGRLRIQLRAARNFEAPDRLSVRFLHRTRSGLDRSLYIEPSAAMVYEAETPDLAPGHWDVLLEAGDWRLVESLSVRR